MPLRPITVTTLPSVCESYVAQKAYLAPKFDPQQFGNIRPCSTFHSGMNFLNYRIHQLQRIFIDFRKAFILVYYTKVIFKAALLGLKECLLGWETSSQTDDNLSSSRRLPAPS